MLGESETTSSEFQTVSTGERKSLVKRGVAIVCAIAVTAGLMIGYSILRWRHAERLRIEAAKQAQIAKPIPSPQVQLFLDDAMIKGSEAVIGGTIQNISNAVLTGVTVELELKRRKDGGAEVRVVSLEPRDLEPQQQGRYALKVPAHEYRETRVQRIRSSSTAAEVPFKILPGAQRPPERLPTKETIIVRPSPRRGKGEEFINTPDNPVSIP